MIYYLILPAWVLAIIAISIFCIFAKFSPSMQSSYPLAIRVLTWSSIGFVVANCLIWLIIYLLTLLTFTDNIFFISTLAAMTIFGPIAASVIGFGGGTLYALRRNNLKNNLLG